MTQINNIIDIEFYIKVSGEVKCLVSIEIRDRIDNLFRPIIRRGGAQLLEESIR